MPAGHAGTGLAALIDVETTGFSPRWDEVVELALILFAFDRAAGGLLGIVEEYVGLRQPTQPIPAQVVAVHGITDDMVAGRRLDDARVRQLLDRAELLVAHNAAFDRGFVAALYSESRAKPWLCSLHDIDWRGCGAVSAKLPDLLRAHGIAGAGAHRGLVDGRATLDLLACRGRDGSTYFQQMLRRRGLLPAGAASGSA